MLRRVLRAVADRELDALLSGTSRSFYLSLAVMPSGVRAPLSIAYLVARAADTIADTSAVRPERRRELLDELRAAVADLRRARPLAEAVRRELVAQTAVPAERALLERLDDALLALGRSSSEDRRRIGRVIEALTRGMARDLERFPPAGSGAAPVPLGSLEELDEHCYLAAGCVGEFWTEITAAHLPEAAHLARPDRMARAVALGKALQMVNVVRDAPADLAEGRCYFPRPLLERHGLEPADLAHPSRRRAARPLIEELLGRAIELVDEAWPYVQAVPPRALRLRLACIWPLWIGLGTLARLRTVDDPLDPGARVKVTRGEVWALVAESTALAALDPLLDRAHRRRRAVAAGLLAPPG
jgi:farnesyl-diphosphate farnesyltransferase